MKSDLRARGRRLRERGIGNTEIGRGPKRSGIILNCTNRVGQAEEYFAADDLWQKRYPASKAARRATGSTSRKALTRAPVSEWLLKTNENTAAVTLKRVQLVQSAITDFNSGEETTRRQLRVSFRLPVVKRDMQPNIKAKLVDDHGCSFPTYGHGQNGNTFEVSFSVVPYGSKEIVLSLSREDHQDEKGQPFTNGPRETKLASFTLTNLCRVKPAEWKADRDRPRRDLDIVSIELTSFDPQVVEFARPPVTWGRGAGRFRHRRTNSPLPRMEKPRPAGEKSRATSKTAGEMSARTSASSVRRRK